MFVGSLEVTITIPCNDTLKGKRRVVKSLLDRLRGRYNVGAAEVDSMESHSIATLGVATVSNDRTVLQRLMNDILRWIEDNWDGEVSSYDITIT
ncbi:MAG TPA: DUF503 domain-containing protein [Firmicutes bacterium]|nr:DUF503 domain-containing protein [Bacillota bacterium]